MTITVTETSGIPLHRLLKRREAEVLLLDHQKLLAGGDLALVGADGHVFVGTGTWPASRLADLLAQASQDQVVRSAELLLQPLLVKSQLLGAVVADDPGAEHVLRCLGHSLSLLLLQALETRDVVRETLDRYREINLLYNIGETIGSCLDPEEIPHLMLAEADRIIPAEAGVVLLPSATSTQVDIDLEIRASSGNHGHAQALSKVWHHIAGQVVRSGRPAIVTNLPDAPALSGPILCAPLKAQEQVLGAVLLGRQAGEPEFTAGDEKLLMALAGQAAIALETARLHQEQIKRQRLEEELSIAREIQLSLLPETCPVIPGWEFAAAYRPARSIGGDLYDFQVAWRASAHGFGHRRCHRQGSAGCAVYGLQPHHHTHHVHEWALRQPGGRPQAVQPAYRPGRSVRFQTVAERLLRHAGHRQRPLDLRQRRSQPATLATGCHRPGPGVGCARYHAGHLRGD